MKLGKPIATIYYEDPNTQARFVFGSITPDGVTHFSEEAIPANFSMYACQEATFLSKHFERNDQGKSREILTFNQSLYGPLILALTRPSPMERLRARGRGFRAGGFAFRYACYLSCIACERCANVLLYQHGSKDGYALHSEDWFKCSTNCELCEDEPRYIPKSQRKLTLVKNSPDAG